MNYKLAVSRNGSSSKINTYVHNVTNIAFKFEKLLSKAACCKAAIAIVARVVSFLQRFMTVFSFFTKQGKCFKNSKKNSFYEVM